MCLINLVLIHSLLCTNSLRSTDTPKIEVSVSNTFPTPICCLHVSDTPAGVSNFIFDFQTQLRKKNPQKRPLIPSGLMAIIIRFLFFFLLIIRFLSFLTFTLSDSSHQPTNCLCPNPLTGHCRHPSFSQVALMFLITLLKLYVLWLQTYFNVLIGILVM